MTTEQSASAGEGHVIQSKAPEQAGKQISNICLINCIP